MKQMKQKFFKIKNARKASFLIGDSLEAGRDQVISGDLKYNKLGLQDERNAHILEEARKLANEWKCFNIRIETVYYDAICINLGIIDYKECKRTCKPFDLWSKKQISWI